MGANAQTSVPTFTAGDVLTAANMNISARTGVPVFANTTDRDAAFGGTGEKTLAEGQLCYVENLTGVAQIQYYDGASWVSLSAGGLALVKAETAISAASSVTADNVFTSTYTNYKLVIRYTTSTTNDITLKLRVGGVSASTNYNTQSLVVNNTTLTGSRATSQTSLQNCMGQSQGAFFSAAFIDIFSPQLAEATNFVASNSISQGAYTSPVTLYTIGNHSTATAYDGIELLVSTGTFSGNYTIYGYAK